MAVTNENFVGEELPLWIRVLFSTLHLITALNGILGCVLIPYSLIRNNLFRSAACTYTVYMGNLVIADLYMEGYHFPLVGLGLAMGRLPMANEAHCIASGYMAMASHTAYLLTLTAISFDRYMKVCHFIFYQKYFSKKTSVSGCVLIWAIGFATPVVGLVRRRVGFDGKSHTCFMKASADLYSARTPRLAFFFVSIILSGYFSLMIYRTYSKSRRRIEEICSCPNTPTTPGTTMSSGASVRSSDMALLRSLLVIYMCVVLFVTPLMAVQSMESYYQPSSSVHVFLVWLLSLNNSVDWIVYGLLNTRFRDDFKKIFSLYMPACVHETLCYLGYSTAGHSESVRAPSCLTEPGLEAQLYHSVV